MPSSPPTGAATPAWGPEPQQGSEKEPRQHAGTSACGEGLGAPVPPRGASLFLLPV